MKIRTERSELGKPNSKYNLNHIPMKTKTILITAILFSFILSAQLSAQKATRLFNGKDFKGWVFHLRDPKVDPSTVFTVRDGVINIKGEPFGYMRTKKSYSNYTLHVEWRYPSELSNSGVFVHTQTPDTIWPRCIENQLKAGNAGDYVLMNGATIKEQTDPKRIVVAKMADSNEKPVGEWNTIEITCKGNTIETRVNGLLQNKGTGLNVTKGSICLQSEGKTIEFRNVYLTKIK